MARSLLLIPVLAALLSGGAWALDTKQLTGSWIAKWPNGTQNDLLLGSNGGRLSGTYVNDSGEACAVTGNYADAARRIVLTVSCPKWDIQMEGVASGDGKIAQGTYKAYGDSAGTFTMRKR